MNQISEYVHEFFAQLHIGADEHEKHHYKDFIEAAINRFLEDEDKDNAKDCAYDVYHVFLDCYGYTAVGEQHSFIEFLDQMRRYEQNAAALELNVRIFRDVTTEMIKESRPVERAVQQSFVAHSLKRVCDQCANIAESTIFIRRAVDYKHKCTPLPGTDK